MGAPLVTLDPTEIDRTCTELATYYGALADERATHPTEDLLTDLARNETEGHINRTELLSLLAILLLAGHETTTGARQALQNITIAGQHIRAGQNVTVMLGAANRDPARFPDPHQLRVDRDDPAPISFGHGIHHCIGATLARLELRVALPAIIDTLGEYAIDDTHLEWKTSLALRSPTRLPIQPTHSPA